jgi:proteasome lid subunit RPN8/RPN11
MFQALVSKANRLFQTWTRTFFQDLGPTRPVGEVSPPSRPYQPLERVRLTDEVGRTLFEEYADHRKSSRGEEETGWILLGLREETEAVVLATLPAGAERDAGVAHVRFNSSGQVMGSRIVRQMDRRLSILGVVHTHPGSLRHPSDGDFEGDSQWVGHLRGGEGVFAIGTADGQALPGPLLAHRPKPHIQAMGDLCLSWYALRKGESRYRPLPVEFTLGPDLARPLHSIWSTIEAHADALDRLFRQQSRVSFDVVMGPKGPALGVNLQLAEPAQALRVLLDKKEVHYFLVRGDDLLAVEARDPRVDRGVYLLLAELAGQC